MPWGYGPVFVIPLVLVVGSGDVDDAVHSTVSGALWEGFRSVDV